MSDDASLFRRWLGAAVQVAGIVLVIMAAKTAIAEPYYVPSGSMEPTLLVGDGLLATKFAYGYSTASLPVGFVLPRTERILGALPQRGDVVVFRYPGDRSQVWVKRVVGLPGDRVQMRAGRLWINGKPVGLVRDTSSRDASSRDTARSGLRYVETLPGGRSHPILKQAGRNPLDDTPEIAVPAGQLFVMGDNRDNSADSRVDVASGGVGLLPVSDLIGRVDALVASWDLSLKEQPIWTWPSGLRFGRFFTAVH